jgi:hypothetical protein
MTQRDLGSHYQRNRWLRNENEPSTSKNGNELSKNDNGLIAWLNVYGNSVLI